MAEPAAGSRHERHELDQPLLELEHGWKKFAKSLAANRKRMARAIYSGVLGADPGHGDLRKGEYWALRDVSLTLRKGEAIGLLGRNGAGKSTLLRILGGHLGLDKGQLTTNGRIGELINLTAGYQSVLTGRENIRFGCTMRGMSKPEIDERMEDILEFAEIGDFVDAPFGTYSSGMRLRLAFSVAVNIDPDILLIDEVIGVGDFGFRQKCIAKMQELRERCAVIMCTHSTGMIKGFCDRAIVLEHGRSVFEGNSHDAVEDYNERLKIEASDTEVLEGDEPMPAPRPAPSVRDFHDENAVTSMRVSWVDDSGNEVRTFKSDPARLKIEAELADALRGRPLSVILFLFNAGDERIARIATEATPDASGRLDMTLQLQSGTLSSGQYNAEVKIGEKMRTLTRRAIAPLEIRRNGEDWGLVRIGGDWRKN